MDKRPVLVVTVALIIVVIIISAVAFNMLAGTNNKGSITNTAASRNTTIINTTTGTSTVTTQNTASSISLVGGGSTLVNPQMSSWARVYGNITSGRILVNYQSIGSAAGQRGVLDGSLDFGASDIPMTPDNYRMAQSKGLRIIQFPIIAGSVAVVYNLPTWNNATCGPLRLSAEVIAGIYLGKIVYWDDPKIVELQIDECKRYLPHREIIGVHRSDGSGTTALFTMFLSKTVPEWNSTVGYGLTVNWPIDQLGRGVGGKGNEGVTAAIKQTPYSIGYVEPIYAIRENLPIAAIRNKDGNFVLPTEENVQEALKRGAKDLPPLDQDLSLLPLSFIYQDGSNTYPIVGTPFVIISLNQSNVKLLALKEFFRWVLTEGQSTQYILPGYLPLPQELTGKILNYLDQYIK
ncbi:MAG: phosphate ABC transporter substrate-binding protein PstS [Sulfolobales archaeon]